MIGRHADFAYCCIAAPLQCLNQSVVVTLATIIG
jgi:hypothetical protein